MKIVTPGQMNKIDSMCINEVGIPGVVLMENAALKVVDEAQKYLGGLCEKSIFIFAGKGNNGGDAFAAARHLHNRGAKVRIFATATVDSTTGDARVNLNILQNMEICPTELLEDSQVDALRNDITQADLIIDGIFGTGIKGKIEGLPKLVIDTINNSGRRVISIDIPSGVNGETGEVQGTCVKAGRTVTFAMPKIGLCVHPGSTFAGDIITADIGIPSKVIDSMNIQTNLMEDGCISKLIPGRTSNSNKGDYGRVFIITGSKGMTGAGCLAAGAALRSGAGLVYLGVPSSLTHIYGSSLMEAVSVPLEDGGTGYLKKESLEKILSQLEKVTVVAVGPGLSVNEEIIGIVEGIIENCTVPLVLDADALNAVSKNAAVLKKLKTEAVVTPHPGEMARLAGISIKEVQNNRIEVARGFAHKWEVITVLKGAGTVVASPDGTVFINPTGNSGMATAGTGDVLAGIIAGLIGQGARPKDAAAAGVYLHGLAGDAVAEVKGEHGLIAGDLLGQLPYVIKKLAGQRLKVGNKLNPFLHTSCSCTIPLQRNKYIESEKGFTSE